MLKKMKSEKGVTLVALALTIIILMILAGISISAEIFNIGKSKDQIAKAELEMVQHAVLEQYAKYKATNNASILKGTKIDFSQAKQIADEIGVTLKQTDGYYNLYPEEARQIGVRNAEDNYIINYETGEIINKTKKKTKSGEALYVSF